LANCQLVYVINLVIFKFSIIVDNQYLNTHIHSQYVAFDICDKQHRAIATEQSVKNCEKRPKIGHECSMLQSVKENPVDMQAVEFSK